MPARGIINISKIIFYLSWGSNPRSLDCHAKRDSFNKFISTIEYRKDSTKTYSFLNKLPNKYERPQKEPFSINGRVIESDAEIANTFALFYSQSQKNFHMSYKMTETLRRKPYKLSES